MYFALIMLIICSGLELPLISAGSINSWTRLEATKSYGFWAFTIGSAFFDRKFAPDGDFGEQIMAVWNAR